jgi:hypothetical protein
LELIVVELDIGTELEATECAVVTGAALVGGTDLGSGRGRWMESNCNGRHEYRRGGIVEQRGLNPSCDREQGRIAQSGTSNAGVWMRMSQEVRTGSHARATRASG